MKNYATILFLCTALCTGYAKQSTAKSEVEKQLKIEFKDTAKPDLYIDGKKTDYAVFELLDSDKIATIEVIKGQRAIDEFQAPNGVVKVTTHAYVKTTSQTTPAKDLSQQLIDIASQPLILIDNKEVTRAQLQALDVKDIESITVLKDAAAMAKYNATNGVILITLKK